MSKNTIKKKSFELNKPCNKEVLTLNPSVRKSMFDISHYNIFNKFHKKIKNPNIFISNPNNNKMKLNQNISPFSTGECTLNSSKYLIDSNTYKNSRKSLIKVVRKNGTKRINKVKLYKMKLSENEQFLHELLFYYFKENININKQSQIKNDKNQNSDKNKNFNYRNYIVKSQIYYNQDFELFYLNNLNSEYDDFIQIKTLEDLISRYFIIIYYLLKINLEESKTLFLLMLKENEKYIDLFEYKIYKVFSKNERRINILKTIPRTGLILIKFFSLIIKYSIIFKIERIKNKFLFRYLSLHSLIYRIFRKKCEIRGFTTETKNHIKFWFTSGLHFASYFTLYHYFSLKIPIALSELILKVYKNADESMLNSNEKSMLVNTSYNNSFLMYTNGQNDQALKSLEETKQRIITYYEERNINNFNIMNASPNSRCSNFGITCYNNNINPVIQNSLRRSLFSKLKKKTYIHKENTFNSNTSYIGPVEIIDNIDRIMTSSNRKNSLIKMDHIKSLFLVELQKNMKNNEKTLNLLDNNFENLQLFKSESNSIKEKNSFELNGRNSSMAKKPLLDIKNYDIPKYMKNPLLIKIELLICEIQIDKKNFIDAYEHIKISIIIMFLMKNIGEIKLYENFKEEIRKMLTYLNQIEELNNINIKKRQKPKNNSNGNVRISFDNSNIDNNISFNHNKTNISLDNSHCSHKSNYIKNIQCHDYNNSEYQKGFLVEEIEKFFIFLNSLSLYQLKLLNDFQPKTNNKNDLPIIFHSQFKDSLTTSQRISLENLQTMTLSRYMILENPDKPIFPTNLRFRVIKSQLKTKNNNSNNIDNYCFYNKTSNNEKNESYNDIPINNKNHGNFQKIILSKNNNIELRKFLFENYDIVIKILKESNENEIKNIIENPTIIEEPIKMFLKKKKNSKKVLSVNKQCFKINDYNYLFRNSSVNKEPKNKIAKKIQKKRMKSSFYTIDDFSFGSKKKDKPKRLSFDSSKLK